MTAEGWQRVGALFDRALAESPSKRTALVRSSSEAPDIQVEVLALLASHEAGDGFLEPAALLEAGTMVGAYRIDRILGSVKILDFGLAQFDLAAQDLASVTRLTDPGVPAATRSAAARCPRPLPVCSRLTRNPLMPFRPPSG